MLKLIFECNDFLAYFNNKKYVKYFDYSNYFDYSIYNCFSPFDLLRMQVPLSGSKFASWPTSSKENSLIIIYDLV